MFVATRLSARRLGLTIGIIVGASSAGAALLPPLLGFVIEAFNWRAGAFLVAGLLAGISLPAAVLIGIHVVAPGAAGGRPQPVAFSLTAFRGLQPIFAVAILTGIAFMGIYIHFVGLMAATGRSATSAAFLLGAINAVSTIGLVLIGWCADRFGAARALVPSLLFNAAAMLLLAFSGSLLPWGLIGVLMLWGVVQGAPTQLLPILLVQRSGREQFGLLSGTLNLTIGIGNALGPVVIGFLHERSGSFEEGLQLAATLFLLAAVLTWSIRPQATRGSHPIDGNAGM